MEAVVEFALARPLTTLHFGRVHLSVISVPPLARLLRNGALRVLHLHCQWVDGGAAAMLADALSANTTLTHVALYALPRVGVSTVTLLRALIGHRHVRCVCLWELPVSYMPDTDGVLSDGLAALVRANAAALEVLSVDGYVSSDRDLGAMVDALAVNTRLRVLAFPGRYASDAFVNGRLLTAVRANRSLRTLQVEGAEQAVAHVRDRSRRRAA